MRIGLQSLGTQLRLVSSDGTSTAPFPDIPEKPSRPEPKPQGGVVGKPGEGYFGGQSAGRPIGQSSQSTPPPSMATSPNTIFVTAPFQMTTSLFTLPWRHQFTGIAGGAAAGSFIAIDFDYAEIRSGAFRSGAAGVGGFSSRGVSATAGFSVGWGDFGAGFPGESTNIDVSWGPAAAAYSWNDDIKAVFLGVSAGPTGASITRSDTVILSQEVHVIDIEGALLRWMSSGGSVSHP